MASQTSSNLSIPNDSVIPFPGRSKTATTKPVLPNVTDLVIVSDTRSSSNSVIVETVSTGNDAKPSASTSIGTTPLTASPSETVPASREVSVDITSASATGTSKSSDDNKHNKQFSTFSFASKRDSHTTTTSDGDDKKPSNDDSTKNNDKKKNNKKNDMSSTTTPPSSTDFSTLFCMFVFDTDPTHPLLAQCLNGGFDLLFDIDDILKIDGSLPLDPSFRLRAQLKYLIVDQAVATGDSTDGGYMSASRQLINKTITDSLTFSGDMGHGGTAKG